METLPLLRTKQYAKHPYDKIVIFSSPRTGSSLTYNIFRFLFEEETALSFPHTDFRLDKSVLKTHKIPEIELLNQSHEKILFIITVRDPIEASISSYRVRFLPVENMQIFCERLIERQIKYVRFIENLKQAGYPVAILRYEEFTKGEDEYLINFIETFFHLSIDPIDKELIRMGYSRENIYANICSLPNFREVLPLSGFHGKHVSFEEFIPSEHFFYWLHSYLEPVKSLFQLYGYFNESGSDEEQKRPKDAESYENHHKEKKL